MNGMLRLSIAGAGAATGVFALLSFWPDGQVTSSPVVSPPVTASSSSAPLPAAEALSLPADSTFAGAVDSILKIQSPLPQEQALAGFVDHWVTRDALAAAEQAHHMGSPELRTRLLRLVLEAWTAKDFHAALAWASHLADQVERDASLSCICTTMGARSPAGAVKVAAAFPPNAAPPGLLPNLAAQWMERDPVGAFQWVKQQPPGESRDALMARASFVWSKTNPEEAADLVINDMSPGPAQDEAAMSVLHQWALQDLDAAGKWAAVFPEGSLHTRAMQELDGLKKQP